jgi:hypothetical protein
MLRCLAVAALSAVAVSVSNSAALGQVIYEPVQYQFDRGYAGEKYYYGGTNPLAHQWAQVAPGCRAYGYAGQKHNFDGGNSFNQPQPFYDRSPVFTDCVHSGLQDARRTGYTEADARNEAYANAPTYFRKADLLASAQPGADGVWHVPPSAPNVYVVGTPVNGAYPAATRGATTGPATGPGTVPGRGQVIIIPRRLLDKPLKDLQDKKPLKVASAK